MLLALDQSGLTLEVLNRDNPGCYIREDGFLKENLGAINKERED